MKRPAKFLAMAIFLATAAAMIVSCEPPDSGIPSDHFQVRFSGDLAQDRKSAIGKTTADFVIDPGYFPNNTTTAFYNAPADTYNIYDYRDLDPDWLEIQTDYVFAAQTQYEIQGAGLNAWIITVLP